jgi:hypothetical protein
MAVRLSALRARPLISVKGWVDPRAIVRLKGIDQLEKISNDLIENRTRDPPNCSIVHQIDLQQYLYVCFYHICFPSCFVTQRSPVWTWFPDLGIGSFPWRRPTEISRHPSSSLSIHHLWQSSQYMRLIHSRSWALLEKPQIEQPLKNFPAFYEIRRFITVFTRALYRSLS